MQAVDLRSNLLYQSYDASHYLSPETLPLYQSIREITNTPSANDKPWLWNDCEQLLDFQINKLRAEMRYDGVLTSTHLSIN